MNNVAAMNDDKKIPLLGFGTWKLTGNDAYSAVKTALEIGYRHIDTATIYGNEEEVGRAIADSGIARDELFVTTKLWNDDHDNAEESLKLSLEKLGLEYVDLYLMHWPELTRKSAWEQMIDLQKKGLAKSIGVSNFTQKHLTELLTDTSVTPAVNQVEFSPFLNQQDLLAYCVEKGIMVEAYSPLTHANKLDDERLIDIAEKYDKTPAQVLLRWAVQQNIVVIPKSGNEDRIKQNYDIFDFDISEKDMNEMNSWNENARYCGDPTSMP